MRVVRTLAASGLLLLGVTAPASADSIAYVKDNNIWLANPDGSHQVQVTRDGTAAVPYRSPSQADDGRIAAGHGGEIVKLAQSGQVLARFAPPTATDSAGQVVEDVPQQIAMSPSGSRIAYVYSQPSCPVGAPCGVRQVMLYSYPDRTTPASEFGQQTGLTNPSWIDDHRVLAFGGHFHQVNVDSPGGGDDDASYWFDDPGNEDVADGELSRAGDRLALVRSYGPGTHIAIYQVDGIGGPAPDPACYTGKDASLTGPSWSPDGSKLAFADSEGIEVLPLPQVVPGDCPGAGSSAVILPGASQPDWGPAAIGADAGTWTPGPGLAAQGGQPTSQPSGPVAGLTLQVLVPRRFSLKTAVRSGVVIRIRSSMEGRIAATASVKRRSVAGKTVTATAGTTVRVRLHVKRVSLAWLRRSHVKKITLSVTLRPVSGNRVTRTATIRITR
jgi:hypothetical protein